MELEEDMLFLNNLKYQNVSEVFQEISDIPYAVVKGEPLSLAAYGAFGCRGFGDIDLLIPRSYLDSVERILRSLQYKTNLTNRRDRLLLMSYSHQLIEYTKYYDDMMIEIDLNFDILWGEYQGSRIDMDNFLSDTIAMDIHGIRVKTLTPIKALIQLVLHHYKDMNSIFLLATKKSIKHIMFKDLYYYFKNNKHHFPLEKLYKLCEKYEVVPYVYYILYYTGLLFDDKDLQQYVDAFYCEEGNNLIDHYGLNESEQHKWSVDFKTRLDSNNLFDLIKDDLTVKDIEKININKKLFLSE